MEDRRQGDILIRELKQELREFRSEQAERHESNDLRLKALEEFVTSFRLGYKVFLAIVATFSFIIGIAIKMYNSLKDHWK